MAVQEHDGAVNSTISPGSVVPSLWEHAIRHWLAQPDLVPDTSWMSPGRGMGRS